MSEKIVHLSKYRNKKIPRSIEEAAKAAVRRFRDQTPKDLVEPEGLASGDMKKFLQDPDAYEKEDEDDARD